MNFSLLCVRVSERASESILFFEYFNMKYRVFNDRIASSLSLSSPEDIPKPKNLNSTLRTGILMNRNKN